MIASPCKLRSSCSLFTERSSRVVVATPAAMRGFPPFYSDATSILILERTLADNDTLFPSCIEYFMWNDGSLVDLLFEEPFNGWALLESDQKTRGCSFRGNGSFSYRFHIPLLGCGTKRAGYEYTNSLMILYNQRQILEMGDQRKVILCRYPIPVAPAFLEVHRSNTGLDDSTDGTTIKSGSSRNPNRELLFQTIFLSLVSFYFCGVPSW
ncbi:hypothetical protein BV898_14447 [Hypsibius exemplaris]|uniref:ZP domain-containing protein n=1 Tax=Hypsibius exemplaris TaxID=2072580 RepID=A0A9X6RJH9_HYPEX|nr:hypothetical protein BV898_14447 [Hypsibius exemplaris]